MYDFLRKVPLFADLPEADLDRLCEMAEEVDLRRGAILFKEGERGDRTFVIREGALEIIKSSGGREILLAVRGSGDVIGEMAVLEDDPRTATVRAKVDTKLLAIHKEPFNRMINVSPSAARALLNTILNRWRVTEAMLRQGEKMAQLGTLTAGVAHELNNPAAAVGRGTDQLRQAISRYEMAQARLNRLSLTHEQRSLLNEAAGETQAGAVRPPEMDALSRSDREYELEDWLEAQGVPESWALAPTLVDLDLELSELESIAEQFTPEELSIAISWLGATYEVYSLLNEIAQGATRISEIVKALKSYSYLDQAPLQTVDIHEGLDNSLLILRNKIKQGISVKREYADPMPKIQAYGSELNQVWTNIIDNAIDALLEKEDSAHQPEIIIRTVWDGDWIVVEIMDNGDKGIPPEIQNKIFDPFFTTKPPGKGTGLGLNISYNIIVHKHRGDLQVSSMPGKTCFIAKLPVGLETAQGESAPALETVHQASQEEMSEILSYAKTIAVVGMSERSDRPSYTVPEYLQQHGYRIIPVNPNLEEALGEKAYPDLLSIPGPVDVVQIFRRNEFVPEIVEQAIRIGARAVWMQEGVFHASSAEKARVSGLDVVTDFCMRAAHKRMISNRQQQPS